MMSEIAARGPITCGISAPDDFVFKYHSGRQGGVYVDNSGAGAAPQLLGPAGFAAARGGVWEVQFGRLAAADAARGVRAPLLARARRCDTEIDHDVEVVGWGVDDQSGLKYWLVRNSWGTYWGELGFFKVQRGAGGNGALQIESGDCWYGVPEHSIEDAVADGDLEGSMYGLKLGAALCKAGLHAAGGSPHAATTPNWRRKDKALPTDRLEQAWGEWPPLQRALEEPAPPKDGAAAAAPPLGPEAGRWWAALGGAARALGWGAAAADGAVAAS
ncbi:cathepsin X [Monoraphidium neglectum]|uniref:Cathepsin X n=1 Tax=Monoraphidium neglectum TaxID=145388 RepID=A0A0D2MWG1_9CHLO|nr:cathepsin X [Monoraphidium neglectum]KIZ04807.1 cathepsin X [Monoraphidium neglectum]|eukprot:XP_013903826.1 cathepsin X [Monoraphidium neglectum]